MTRTSGMHSALYFGILIIRDVLSTSEIHSLDSDWLKTADKTIAQAVPRVQKCKHKKLENNEFGNLVPRLPGNEVANSVRKIFGQQN
jgi:hypothetical protein